MCFSTAAFSVVGCAFLQRFYFHTSVDLSTWASVLAEIMNDWHSPKGKDLGEVLAGHTPYDWVIKSFFSASRF